MSDAEWIMKQQIQIKDKEIERLREENERLRESLRNVVESGRKGFFTSESHGPSRDYKVVGKFKQLKDAQDYYRQLVVLTKEVSDE